MATVRARSNALAPIAPHALDPDGLLGREIVDLDGRRIGELHDIVFDLESGRIAYVFIALNQDKYADQRVLCPWNAFSVESTSRRLRMNTRSQPLGRGEPPASDYSPGSFAND